MEGSFTEDVLTKQTPKQRLTTDMHSQPPLNTPYRPFRTDGEKNYSYALKFSILDLSPKVTFIFKLEQKEKKKKKVQLFLIHAQAKETHFCSC